MRVATALVGVAIVSLGAPARADSETALDFAKRATAAEKDGQRREAINLLEQAYRIEPLPDYLLQIAEQYEALWNDTGGREYLRRAIDSYRRSLTGETSPSQVDLVQARIRTLEVQAASPSAQAASDMPGPVAITFEGRDGQSFEVSIQGLTCHTPCTLGLKPGNAPLTTTGAAPMKVDLHVPRVPGIVRLDAAGQSRLIPGIVLTTVGAVSMATLWIPLDVAACAPPPNSRPGQGDPFCVLAGLILGPVLSAPILMTGIGLLGYYGTHLPPKPLVEVAGAPTDPAPPLRLASVGFQPLRNGAAAGVAFSF